MRESGCSAKVAELVDALDLGSSGATRESSSLSSRTTLLFSHSIPNLFMPVVRSSVVALNMAVQMILSAVQTVVNYGLLIFAHSALSQSGQDLLIKFIHIPNL